MNNFAVKQPPTYAKAIWAFWITFIGDLVLLVVGDMSPGDLSWAQWLTIVLHTSIATGGVFGLENKEVKQ